MKSFLIVILSFAFYGCGESFSEESKPPSTVKTKSLEPVDVEIIEGSEVAQYSVKFRPLIDKKYSIIKYDYLEGTTEEIAVGVTGEYIDNNVVTGFVYKYEVGEFVEDKSFRKFFEKEIKIPLDLKVEPSVSQAIDINDAQLTEEGSLHISYNRVILGKESSLITNGASIQIKINKLFSHQGKLVTFPEASKAEKGIAGRSGGQIILDANYANGDFKVILRGENGGDARRPAPLGSKGRGKKGSKGKREGLAYIKTNYGPQGSLLSEEEYCKVRPGTGGVGGRGKRGLPGNTGHRGGDSGIALIYIKNSDNFEVSHLFAPGKGGSGSLGGGGGAGGYGGDPGTEKLIEVTLEDGRPSAPDLVSYNNPPQVCGNDRSKDGPEGLIGPTGKNGAEGLHQKICIKENRDKKLECFSENKK